MRHFFVLFPGLQEAEVNEFMLVFLGLGIASFIAMALIIYCRRYRSHLSDDMTYDLPAGEGKSANLFLQCGDLTL